MTKFFQLMNNYKALLKNNEIIGVEKFFKDFDEDGISRQNLVTAITKQFHENYIQVITTIKWYELEYSDFIFSQLLSVSLTDEFINSSNINLILDFNFGYRDGFIGNELWGENLRNLRLIVIYDFMSLIPCILKKHDELFLNNMIYDSIINDELLVETRKQNIEIHARNFLP